jgi:tRNA nucleotidyltransferase/poly(A) polymerase
VHKQEVIDYVGGLKDIEASEIHMIGDARVRFKEDPVRMIRAIILFNTLRGIDACFFNESILVGLLK